jgi:uncharacterized protein YidB (DUF937 family)
MGLLDEWLGGVVGGEMATVVSGLIATHGGVWGLVNEFEKNGPGSTITSWVGTGPNLPTAPEQVHHAVGPSVLTELAAKAGPSSQDLASKRSALRPKAVDSLTPSGAVSWTVRAHSGLVVQTGRRIVLTSVMRAFAAGCASTVGSTKVGSTGPTSTVEPGAASTASSADVMAPR